MAQSQQRPAASSLSPLEWWFTHSGEVRKDGSAAPKVPPAPPAFEFIRAVRAVLGTTQGQLADRIGADRSMVGKWEMEEDGDAPSWPYIGRILVLIGIIDATGKGLRTYTNGRVELPPMRNMESDILSELRKLPEDKLTPIYRLVISEVTKHELTASQAPAALKKG